MPHIIYVTATEPNPIGHGGNHRAYQITYELMRRFGAEAVTVLNYQYRWSNANNTATAARTPKQSPWTQLQLLIARTRENPFKFFGDTYFSIDKFSDPTFLHRYEQIIRTAPPELCVIDSVCFSAIVRLNRRYGIPTVACCHDVMALDTMDPSDSRLLLPVTTYNFANELKLLAACDERICISPAETALIGGLGYSACYFPYQPVGEIATNFDQIRRARQSNHTADGPLLMIGSAHHPTTREGMRWLLEQVRQQGLPDGVQLIVTGGDTEKLLPVTHVPSGVTLTGWIVQNQLNQLLTTVRGVLIPHWRGFGALTKLSELAYAGLPMIVSQHPLYSFPSLPGVIGVDRQWAHWQAAITQIGSLPHTDPPAPIEYNSTLIDILERYVHL